MKHTDEILNELKEMGSKLAEMPRTMPYVVPEGYFEQLDKQLLSGIMADGNTGLPAAIKSIPYEVPQDYFNNLPQQMLFAALESDKTADLPKAMPFETPKGYFDQLPGRMLDAARNADAAPKPKARTISLGKSLRWAAAAVLLLGIGLTAYRLTAPEAVDTAQAISALPNNVIDEYVQQNFTEAGVQEQAIAANTELSALDQLNEDDIENYLDATGWDESLIN